jgi:hypothetical protein
MTLDTNRLILLAEEEKLRLFNRFGELDAVPVPIDVIRASPGRLLPFEAIADASESFQVQASRSALLSDTVVTLNQRLMNYSPFVQHARELLEQLSSVATRAYMMVDADEDKQRRVQIWANFKTAVVEVYAALDELLVTPDSDLRHATLLTLRRLYETALAGVPETWRPRFHLQFTDDLFGELNLLMEQCEVYALVEELG